MKNFVLVHGAWHGGWCWKRVLPQLRAAGHEAYAPTLTGVGERSHLLSADIRLKTHIQDVIGLIDSEELDNVVLVGHSYAGMIITGVADLLLQRDVPQLRHLIYVDAVTPHPGESWSSQHTAETIAARVKAARATGGVSMPSADASAFGLEGPDREWVNRRQTPHPFGVYQDPLMFDAQRVARVKRTFVDCTSPALPTIAVMRQRVRTEPGWQVVELKTGHDPMVSQPDALARLLLE
ncbi:MAG TPA: alpha/beta hydrolase [Noviherbaspirillum sp.]|uniref:alpha/beta fold hydrolase n=1 Tax=Noviherbaspirillum sp. TaxID=1926288 RepID=UPI002DDD384B|nr:alpha/beta hydrolase [Noviherbaspirillum sp.]HEV2610916.1 alpha/beta hydrolase [Noviherbaspirillum sp.]